MYPIDPGDVTQALRALFSTGEPQARRCFAVLYGLPPAGKIFVDHPQNPRWGVVQEPVDNTLFFGGAIEAHTIAAVIEARRADGDVLVGVWPWDHRIPCLPLDPAYSGRAIEFYDRPHGDLLDQHIQKLPAGLTLKRLDGDLVMRTECGPEKVRRMGGLDAWKKYCSGYCLMRDDEILSEATVGPPALGLYEPLAFTRSDQRGKGYATLVASKLIQEIESLGGITYWNCAKQNIPSTMLARKLGYRVEKEYRCMVWAKLD